MAGRRGGKNTRQAEFESLDPALQQRVRRTLRIAGIWFSGVILSAGLFYLAKPFIKKKRLERMKQPGYKPSAVLRHTLPYGSEEEKTVEKKKQ